MLFNIRKRVCKQLAIAVLDSVEIYERLLCLGCFVQFWGMVKDESKEYSWIDQQNLCC